MTDLPPVLINKVLLEHTHAHSFVDLLWMLSRYNTRVEQLRRRPNGWQSRQHLLPGPSQKSYSDPRSKSLMKKLSGTQKLICSAARYRGALPGGRWSALLPSQCVSRARTRAADRHTPVQARWQPPRERPSVRWAVRLHRPKPDAAERHFRTATSTSSFCFGRHLRPRSCESPTPEADGHAHPHGT